MNNVKMNNVRILIKKQINSTEHIIYVFKGLDTVLRTSACADLFNKFYPQAKVPVGKMLTVKRAVNACERVGVKNIDVLIWMSDFYAAIKSPLPDKLVAYTLARGQIKMSDAKERISDVTADAIEAVYSDLKNRAIHPTGEFDNGGRWYADNTHLINCRAPSRAWPFSEMLACRTKKYVTACALWYGCKSEVALLKVV